MTRQNTDDLLNVSETLRDFALYRHVKILQERQSVETQITSLQAQSTQNVTAEEGLHMSRLGSDVLWRQWATLKRTELSKDLALARAREADSFEQTKTAFARGQVLQELAEKARLLKRQASDRKTQEALQALSMFRRDR